MSKVLREINSNPLVEIGKFYAYEHKGKLYVGKAVKNLTEKPVYEWNTSKKTN